VVRIELAKLTPRTDVLAGGAVGEKHCQQIEAALFKPSFDDAIVVLDFAHIKAVTPSYLKQTIRPLYAPSNGQTNAAFPVYANLLDPTEDDLHHFLLAHRLPGIVVRSKGHTITFQHLIGWLEQTASETFSRLSLIKLGSATDLMENQRGSEIALTAWNNRLAELYRLRLANRMKSGRHWIYKPIVEAKNNG
jgi:hypothetical protein